MRLFHHLSYNAGNLKFSTNSAKYLQTVFNISFLHDNEEISGDFLVHSPANVSTTQLDRVEANLFDFVKRHGFDTKRDLARVTGCSNYALMYPNLSVEQYTLVTNFTATHLLVDDFFDGSQLTSPEHMDMVVRMNRTLSEYIRCNASPINDDIRLTFPKFDDICRMYFELGAGLLECSNDLHHVYQGFDVLVGGNVTQAKLGHAKSAEEYLKRKTDNFGMAFYFALNGALAGETLTDEVRHSAVFRKFENVTAAMCAIPYDPMSILCDLLHGKKDNHSVILTQKGASVKDAVAATIVRCNQLFVESLLLISQLNEMNICESDRRYLRLYLIAMRAALEFPPNHTLYNTNNTFKYKEVYDKDRAAKCIVEALRGVPCI